MTNRPRLKTGSHLVRGLGAVALFVVMAGVFLTAEFGPPEGFGDANITASLGYALFNLLGVGENTVGGEAFLAPFEIIDVVLVAALVAAVMLARREAGGSVVTVLGDGGREVYDVIRRSTRRDGGADGEHADGGER